MFRGFRERIFVNVQSSLRLHSLQCLVWIYHLPLHLNFDPQIFSVKHSFWKYFLRVKLAESITFSTSCQDRSGQDRTGKERSGQVSHHRNIQKPTLKQLGFNLIVISLLKISKCLILLNLCLSLLYDSWFLKSSCVNWEDPLRLHGRKSGNT